MVRWFIMKFIPSVKIYSWRKKNQADTKDIHHIAIGAMFEGDHWLGCRSQNFHWNISLVWRRDIYPCPARHDRWHERISRCFAGRPWLWIFAVMRTVLWHLRLFYIRAVGIRHRLWLRLRLTAFGLVVLVNLFGVFAVFIRYRLLLGYS